VAEKVPLFTETLEITLADVKAGNLDKAIEVYRQLLTFDPASQDRRIRIPVYHCRLAGLGGN